MPKRDLPKILSPRQRPKRREIARKSKAEAPLTPFKLKQREDLHQGMLVSYKNIYLTEWSSILYMLHDIFLFNIFKYNLP